MFSSRVFGRQLVYMPYVMSSRKRVKILPKEHYESEYETRYMPLPKPSKSRLMDFFAWAQRTTLTMHELKIYFKWRHVNSMRADQKFLPERHRILGPDLATAHFIAFRGGKIKFKGNEEWITDENINKNEIPSVYTPDFYIEEVDASETNLCFEGFDNFFNLRHLKKLFLKNCPFIDDWCLSRLHQLELSLEHLDVSGCQNVTERGLCTLHRLKNLKTLVIDGCPNIGDKELVCLMLQDILPECTIVGVDFNDPELLQRVEKLIS